MKSSPPMNLEKAVINKRQRVYVTCLLNAEAARGFAYLWLFSKWNVCGPVEPGWFAFCCAAVPCLICFEEEGISTSRVPAPPSLLRLDPDGCKPSPAASAVPPEGPHAAAAAQAAGAPGFRAVAGEVTSGAGWFLSAEGDREGGGDLKTAMPKAGNAAPPADSNTSC